MVFTQPFARTSTLSGNAKTRTVKRLQPGAPGTKRLLERFGESLVCVRYRIDPESQLRFTTVELVVEQRAGKLKASSAWVRIAFDETDLRGKFLAAGGSWHPKQKLWLIPATAIKGQGLGFQ